MFKPKCIIALCAAQTLHSCTLPKSHTQAYELPSPTLVPGHLCSADNQQAVSHSPARPPLPPGTKGKTSLQDAPKGHNIAIKNAADLGNNLWSREPGTLARGAALRPTTASSALTNSPRLHGTPQGQRLLNQQQLQQHQVQFHQQQHQQRPHTVGSARVNLDDEPEPEAQKRPGGMGLTTQQSVAPSHAPSHG